MYYVFFILGKTIIIDELDYDWLLYLTSPIPLGVGGTTRNAREKYLKHLYQNNE